MNHCLIRLPQHTDVEFTSLWKDLRIIEGLDSSHDLSQPIQSENFDGTSLVEWIVPISTSIAPIITGLFGYIVAARGEIEIERNGTRIKMKNMKASQLSEIIRHIDPND